MPKDASKKLSTKLRVKKCEKRTYTRNYQLYPQKTEIISGFCIEKKEHLFCRVVIKNVEF